MWRGKNHNTLGHMRAKEIIFAVNNITQTLYSTGQVWVSFSHAYGESIETFKEAG